MPSLHSSVPFSSRGQIWPDELDLLAKLVLLPAVYMLCISCTEDTMERQSWGTFEQGG